MNHTHIGEWRKFDVLKHDEKIGDKLFLKIRSKQDIYYISQQSVPEYDSMMRSIMLEYIRKDLIQVNNLNSGNLYP